MASPTGWATDGGFVFHMQALASSYDETVLLVPVIKSGTSKGEVWFSDSTIRIVPLSEPFGSGILRKLLFPFWFLMELPKFVSQLQDADIVHAPVPGDIGTIGMLLAPLFGKKLFIRYCGNWRLLRTLPEKFWAWYGEKFAGRSIAYLCTGGDEKDPSEKNPSLKWIFSSSMRKKELDTYRRKDFDFTKEFNLVMGGRLIREKGFGILLDAVQLINGKIPKLKVNIFGDGPDTSIFQEKANKLGLDDKVTFSGKLNSNQVHALLSTADIFCFPTFSSEGFPKV
ncbi:MAG: glycosyltransferase, partial [Ginsengibacter sp.]